MAKITSAEIDAIINETGVNVKRRRRPMKAIRARAAKVEKTEQSAVQTGEKSQTTPSIINTVIEKEAVMPENKTEVKMAESPPAPTPVTVPEQSDAQSEGISVTTSAPVPVPAQPVAPVLETETAASSTAAPERRQALGRTLGSSARRR